jgi:pilus assembly protein Flp/PilA
MTKLMKRFVNDESGATAIEYGLIATLIALAIIVAATAVGSGLEKTFNNVAKCLDKTAANGTCPTAS